MNGIRTLPDDWSTWPEYPDSRLACLIALATALRIAEIRRLNCEDFTAGVSWITLRVKSRKRR